MRILFYSTNGCGYCDQAKNLFDKQIKEGVIVVKGPHDAPAGVRGFPHFKSEDTGKEQSGLPKSFLSLTAALGYKNTESFRYSQTEIFFYYMKGCGYCEKAMQMLASHISSGMISVKGSNEAPPRCAGFPHFKSVITGLEKSGLPSSFQSLVTELGHTNGQHSQENNIYLYTTNNCTFCEQAISLLQTEIDKGIVVVKNASDAPSTVSGFPYFLNPSNNKSMMGLPSSSQILFSELEFTPYKQRPTAMLGNYHRTYLGEPVNPIYATEKQKIQADKWMGM
jgi:glutaredoxin